MSGNNKNGAKGGGKRLTKAQKKAIHNMIAAELEVKYYTFGLSTTVSNTGSCTSFTTLAAGLQGYARVGDRIEVKKIEFNYRVAAPVGGLLTAADSYDTVRVILFRWKPDDSVDVPVIANLLSPPIGAAHSESALYNYNRDKADKYRILYDRVHTVFNSPVWDGSAVRTAAGFGHSLTESVTFTGKKCGGKFIDYMAGTNTGLGNVYVAIVSDSAFSPHPAFVCSVQIDFTDA